MSILASLGRGKGFTNVKPAFVPPPDSIQIPYCLAANGAVFPVLPTVKLFYGTIAFSAGTPRTILTCDVNHYTVITGFIVATAVAIGNPVYLIYNGTKYTALTLGGSNPQSMIMYTYPGILIDLGTTNLITVDCGSGSGNGDVSLLGYQPPI